MRRESISVEPEKAHRLTLAELAAHDDACSDAMVDNAYFKSQIRKNKTKYFPLRIKEDEIPQILLHKLIVQKDPTACEKALLQVPGLKRYRASLRSKAEQENFLKHLRKYIDMYQTDCPWEVSTTNRYTITTYEAAVTARQRVKQGQVIKYLVGTLVPLTAEESTDLDHTNRNFSIVVSSRKKNASIFLGPARFANHDCDANGRLVTRGTDAMEVVAMKNIEVGDEITVSYGDDYFGPSNMDCLCHTCERLVRNGWTAARSLSDSPRDSFLSTQEPAPSASGKTKRKRDSVPSSDDRTTLRASKKLRAKPSPSKLQHSWTPCSSTDPENNEVEQKQQLSEGLDPTPLETASQDSLRLSPPTSPDHTALQEHNVNADEHVDENVVSDTQVSLENSRSSVNEESEQSTKADKLTAKLREHVPSSKQYPLSPASTAASIGDSTASSSFISAEPPGDKVTIKIETVETTKIETDTIVVSTSSDHHEPPRILDDKPMHQPTSLSTLITTEVSKTTPVLSDASTVLPSIEPHALTTTIRSSTAQLTVKSLSQHVRTPGDYILTRKLLAQPHDRWVQCQNERCLIFFIQPNGYQTRRECPRCERHSMLYGFSWPKTDPDPRKALERSPGGRKGKSKTERSAYRRAGKCGKGSWYEGGGDEEERVMDHRTVHRFVLPEDEKATTRRGLLRQAEKARVSGAFDFESPDSNGSGGAGQRRTESIGLGGAGDITGERGSLTPEGETRRRSNRFVTKVGMYADG